jgi:hypothetical protein
MTHVDKNTAAGVALINHNIQAASQALLTSRKPDLNAGNSQRRDAGTVVRSGADTRVCWVETHPDPFWVSCLMLPIYFAPTLNTFQPAIRVAKMIQLDSEAIHDRKIQTAHLAILVARIHIVQCTSGLQRTPEPTRQHQR